MNETVEPDQSNGPFGAKGVGEVATFCVSPAIANAIDDAVGVRLTELPLNPEAVLRALRAKANRPTRRRRMMGGVCLFGIPGRAQREPGIEPVVPTTKQPGFRVPACRGRPRNDDLSCFRRTHA